VATNAEVALLAATAVHAGFQVTVTVLVYPALFRAQDWVSAHRAHGRAITPVVAVVYAALVLAVGGAILEGVSGPGTVVAIVGVALSLAVTALVAAPLHGRLTGHREVALLRRLRIADLVRTAGAVVGLVGAALAVF
jgi:hypothetical protein